MMKKRILPALFLILALILSACGQEAAGTLPDEPYEAVPYALFPIPEDAYVGDVMPFVTEDGELELYYLYDTDHNGQAYHPVWKYSTPNLYEYEDHGMVLNFGLMSDPDPAIGTGSVMQDREGLYHLFYTGHNDSGNGGRGRECVMHAVSTDRQNWTKDAEPVLFAPEGYSKDDFRDPEVFWVEEEQCYWLLIAARDDTLGGVVARYTSPDLKEWTFCGPFFAPQAQYMLECPDLFCLDGSWYLTYSWDCCTYYAVGESMKGPFSVPGDNVLDGRSTVSGAGFVFYAAKTAQMNDSTYLCGWIGRAGLSTDSGTYQWAGNVLNHELVRHEDGSLGVKAPETLKNYFTAEKPFQAVKKEGSVRIKDNSISLSAGEGAFALADMGTRSPSMTLECDVKLDPGGRAGFAFGGSQSDETYTALCLDADRNLIHYEGYEIGELTKFEPGAFTAYDFSLKEVHHVKLVCENEIVVLYIDDAKALSSRIMHSIDGAHIGVFADGCGASFENITIRLPKT